MVQSLPCPDAGHHGPLLEPGLRAGCDGEPLSVGSPPAGGAKGVGCKKFWVAADGRDLGGRFLLPPSSVPGRWKFTPVTERVASPKQPLPGSELALVVAEDAGTTRQNQTYCCSSVQRSQMRCFGHLVRRPPGRLPGEAFRARPTSRRPPGRTRTRWRDYVSWLAASGSPPVAR